MQDFSLYDSRFYRGIHLEKTLIQFETKPLLQISAAYTRNVCQTLMTNCKSKR